jgi:hypothetical protein
LFFGGRHVITASDLERELEQLASLARRLMPPLNHRPHLFHDQKDALVRGIVALLERSRGAPAPQHAFRAAQRDLGASHILTRGRVIPIERRSAR